MSASIYRQIPSVAAVLDSAAIIAFRDQYLPDEIADAIRTELAAVRAALAAGQSVSPDLDSITRSVAARLQTDEATRLRKEEEFRRKESRRARVLRADEVKRLLFS